METLALVLADEIAKEGYWKPLEISRDVIIQFHCQKWSIWYRNILYAVN